MVRQNSTAAEDRAAVLEGLRAHIADLEARLEGVPVDEQVRRIKARVRETAQRYKNQYGMCGVIDNAVREAGCEATFIPLTVDIDIPASMIVQVDADALAGLSDEEKRAWLADHVTVDERGRVSVQGDGLTLNGDGARLRGTPTVNGMQTPPPPPPDPHGTPNGYQAVYTGLEGRVLHFVSGPSPADLSGAYAMCGRQSYYWTPTSPRGSGRVCGTCSRAAGVENE